MLSTFLITLAMQNAAPVDPLVTLHDAYARRDPKLAARAFGDQAEVVYRYDGAPEERFRGTRQIEDSFATLFQSLDPSASLDLNFRITARDIQSVKGYYRLRVGRSTTAYGKFVAKTGPDGKFSFDESGSANREDFEEARGPVYLAADMEDLDQSYYGAMTGRYRLPDGCSLVVTRSIARLFVRNSCTQEWRGLTRISGRQWTAGKTILDPTVETHLSFAAFFEGKSLSLTTKDKSGREIVATRADTYQTENVTFTGNDGVNLAGTMYIPLGAQKPLPAAVMVHGSGPQDRDGYASIMAVMANEIATNGRAVLAYDKRGSGQSGGDGDRAGFDMLAADAAAGIEFLKGRGDIDQTRIGFAGSSQAGWVIARAIERGAAPTDVLLLGAAGAAIAVRDQNLYNTDVQMRCEGLSDADRRLALSQQSAFFDYLANPQRSKKLNALSKKASTRQKLADWLFPNSAQVNRTDGSWYNVLAVDYDPLPVWATYKGRMHFLFGTFDDATPTAKAVSRLRGTKAEVHVLSSAQHLGLAANSICKAGLADGEQFHPGIFTELARFARKN